MLDQQELNKKRMMLFMKFVRMTLAALCALGLLYMIHQKRLKDQQSQETDPPPQTAPESQIAPDTPRQ